MADTSFTIGITTLLGAQVLFYPTAIGWHPSEKDEWGQAQVDAWRTIQRSHAIANGVYVASPNRIGHEDEPGTNGITFFGHSFIADPFGRYVAEAGENEEIVLAAPVAREDATSVSTSTFIVADERTIAYAANGFSSAVGP